MNYLYFYASFYWLICCKIGELYLVAWLVDEKFQHAMARLRYAAYGITVYSPGPAKVDYSTGSCTLAFDRSIRNIAINKFTDISLNSSSKMLYEHVLNSFLLDWKTKGCLVSFFFHTLVWMRFDGTVRGLDWIFSWLYFRLSFTYPFHT